MFDIRIATVLDAPAIAGHRRAMFEDMGYRDERALVSMTKAFMPWVARRIEQGQYLGWLAIAEDGSVAAGAGLWVMDWPPHMVGVGAKRGNILNVYTRPDCRRQGLARQLTRMAIDWCRAHAIATVILHASDEGRPLYEALGFRATNEMRLTVDTGTD